MPFTCPVCGNSDTNSIGYLNGKAYCRKCIAFKGENAELTSKKAKKSPINLSYSLSMEQDELSKRLVLNLNRKKNTLVFAVTGAGKTEITLEVISKAIESGLKVGFAIPRRDVVLELYHRFKSIFPDNSVVAVYGGHRDYLNGDLICLTTHQLYRYKQYFDLLIMDEIDAFPYKNNKTLHNFVKRATKGIYILLTATPSKTDIVQFKRNNGEVLELSARFHHKPLPEPRIIVAKGPLIYTQLLRQLRRFYKQNKPTFIFTPTIKTCEMIFNLLNKFYKKGSFVHSEIKDRLYRINLLRNGEYRYLVTTAVLERGVTMRNLQVIIFQADHPIYDSYSLIQISGRSGRKKEVPEGEVIYLANKTTKDMLESIKSIVFSNEKLFDMLQTYKKNNSGSSI